MVKFYIDEMRGDFVVALHIAEGQTPLEAVAKVTGGPLVVRTSQPQFRPPPSHLAADPSIRSCRRRAPQ